METKFHLFSSTGTIFGLVLGGFCVLTLFLPAKANAQIYYGGYGYAQPTYSYYTAPTYYPTYSYSTYPSYNYYTPTYSSYSYPAYSYYYSAPVTYYPTYSYSTYYPSYSYSHPTYYSNYNYYNNGYYHPYDRR